ncbi:penicillin acylase family protein [Cellulomonas sp. NPDC055163]
MTAELFRDAWGVPHVRAADHLELAEAQGRVTALDRGWQIEVDRWRAEGRLAERVGAAGLAWDRFARQARLADTAQRAYAALDDDVRAWVVAYVRGVNAGLDAAPRPVELAALDERFGSPTPHEPWPAWAPLGVMLVAHALFSTFPRVLWNAHVERALGAAGLAVLGGADPAEARGAGAVAGSAAGAATGLGDGAAPDDPTEAGGVPTSGSNAWALHGSRTASGRPLLAGDPHRLLELPGVYQQVRLACPGIDVVGLTFPGVPGVQHFGQTPTAAWGITNAMAHGVEVARERVRLRGDGVEALGPDGWEPAERLVERIGVRGGADVEVEVVETPRGVVLAVEPLDRVSTAVAVGTTGATAGTTGAMAGRTADAATGATTDPVHGATRELTAPEGVVVHSVRFPARASADLGFACLLPLLRARTAHDVVGALRGWVDPVNRVLAADADGTVLSATVGRVPARARGERRLPQDAWAPAGRPAPWLDPPEPVEVAEVAVDANERPGRAEVDLGLAYAPPHRAHRIRALLHERRAERLGPADMSAIHADTLLGGAAALLAWIEAADDLTPGADRLRAGLLAWDRHMDACSAPAATFAAWRSALVRRLAAHPALGPLHAPHPHGDALDPWFSVAARVADALPRLLDDTTLGIDAAHEVHAALEEVAASTTVDDAWGDRHRVLASHLLDEIPGCAAPPVPDVPLAGDADCVRCTGTTPSLTDRAWRGSVARWVWDLADRDRSRWCVPFGASGDPRSPHFTDQNPLWAQAATVEVVTDWDRLTPEELV